MPLFSQLKYNNYVPQYVGMPLNEFAVASGAVQDRYNQVRDSYSLIGELADTLQTSPLAADKDVKRQLVTDVQSRIEEAAKRGDFDTMQNEMRKLAKDYAKKATPIKENLARFQSAEKAILDSKLPQSHINYLRSSLYNKPGLSFDEDGNPNYLVPDAIAENVDLREVYEKYINDYKSSKAPDGVYKVMDPETGLVEYYARGSNEWVSPQEVMGGLQTIAATDPKVRSFLMQDAAANGVNIQSGQDYLDYANPLMAAYAEKAGFNKGELDINVGEAGRARARAAQDNLGGLTFDALFGVPAREGTASPDDLKKARNSLDEQWKTTQDEYSKFLDQNGIDPLTGIGKDGGNYKEQVDLYNQQLDGIDAQKWELDKVEADAKRDANLPLNWQPPQKVMREAEQIAKGEVESANQQRIAQGFPILSEPEKTKMYRDAYNKHIDSSNHPQLKAYRTALAKNAQSRTEVKGMTTFGKNATEALEKIGDSILAGTWGTISAKDQATGLPIDNLAEYGTVVKTPMWTMDEKGGIILSYQTGTMDKSQFIPSNKRITVQAPPELVNQLIDKKVLNPYHMEIMRQAATGRVKVADETIKFEVKRPSETNPANVVLVFEDGTREAYASKGDAIDRLTRLAKATNGNK